ncbi:MAG: hypothetical protein HKN82_03770, partial [Akkermansiaceae bacterium]|nr:hypothetical protein [Akkermansiaceae bacterium]
AAPPASDPAPRQDAEAEAESGFREVNPLLPFLAVIGLIVVLLVAAVILNRGRAGAGASGATRSAMEKSRFLREGWREAASQRLQAFLDASTPEQRAPHIIGGRARLDDLRAFYEGGPASEKSTPLSAFSHFDLADADKKRGIFMMRYERPSQFDMREFFRPVAPLEIQYRLEEPGLLLASFASLGNFSMEPVRVMAFFKQSGEDLLLDWDVFVQTKYRTLREFGAYPQPGEVKTFRVIVNEDVATAGAVGQEQVRYYRFADPANSADYVKVPIGVGSIEGRILESLNWIGLSGRGVPSQTATVKLTWTEGENPRLRLQEIVCWEFLGLGGKKGNAVPGEKYNPFPGSPDGQPAEEKPPGAGGAPAGEA